MKRMFHRILFLVAFITYLVRVFSEVLYSNVYKELSPNWEEAFTLLWGMFFLYYIILFIISLYKIIVINHQKKIFWLLAIVFIPFVGVFLYFEKVIFKQQMEIELNSSEELRSLLYNEVQKSKSAGELLWRRVCAFLIDYGVYNVFVGIYVQLFLEYGKVYVGIKHPLILFSVWFVWVPIIESIRGQTVGKLIMKISVINRKGEAPTLVESIKRHIVDPFDAMLCASIPLYTSRRNNIPRRLGDYIAKTWVVRAKNGK